MTYKGPIAEKIAEKQKEIAEETRLKMKKKEVNKIAIASSLIIFAVVLTGLIRILFNASF